MNLAALAISDMNVIKKIYEVLPSELQEQIKKAYPSYFVTHKVGNRYKNTSTGNRYILASEGGAVALVNLENGRIRETVYVNDEFNISEDEMKKVYGGDKNFILIKERK
jgi:hypothetical protein